LSLESLNNDQSAALNVERVAMMMRAHISLQQHLRASELETMAVGLAAYDPMPYTGFHYDSRTYHPTPTLYPQVPHNQASLISPTHHLLQQAQITAQAPSPLHHFQQLPSPPLQHGASATWANLNWVGSLPPSHPHMRLALGEDPRLQGLPLF
jgi:hypothetical protein